MLERQYKQELSSLKTTLAASKVQLQNAVAKSAKTGDQLAEIARLKAETSMLSRKLRASNGDPRPPHTRLCTL